MANWDVFHGDRLELERDLTTSGLRAALARGELCDDDLVRPAGTTVAWTRLADIPQLLEPAEPSPPPSPLPAAPPVSRPSAPSLAHLAAASSDFELQAEDSGPIPVFPPGPAPAVRASDWLLRQAQTSDVAFPVINDEPAEPQPAPAGPKTPQSAPPGGWLWAEEVDDEDQEEEDSDFEGTGDASDFEGRGDVALGLDVGGLEILDDDAEAGPDSGVQSADVSASTAAAMSSTSRLALPVVSSSESESVGALAEVPEEEEFSLSRSGPMTVEELDLAPMVDVAFQLVLFFMVAAQTVLYKTLEIPKPSTEQAPAAVAQGRSKTLDELKDDYILVEIDSSGAMKLDRQPVAADMTTLVEQLRRSRDATRRKAMLLSADFATRHRSAVLAYDAANEIGLGIVIAKPANPQGPAPSLLPGQRPAPATTAPAPVAAKPAPAAPKPAPAVSKPAPAADAVPF